MPLTKPDLMGMVPEAMTVTSLGGEASEMPLPEAELLEGWLPPDGVTQVCYWFILNLFVILLVFSYLT